MFKFTNHNGFGRRSTRDRDRGRGRDAVLFDLGADSSDEPRLGVDDAVAQAVAMGPDLTLDRVAAIAATTRAKDRRRFFRRLGAALDEVA